MSYLPLPTISSYPSTTLPAAPKTAPSTSEPPHHFPARTRQRQRRKRINQSAQHQANQAQDMDTKEKGAAFGPQGRSQRSFSLYRARHVSFSLAREKEMWGATVPPSSKKDKPHPVAGRNRPSLSPWNGKKIQNRNKRKTNHISFLSLIFAQKSPQISGNNTKKFFVLKFCRTKT